MLLLQFMVGCSGNVYFRWALCQVLCHGQTPVAAHSVAVLLMDSPPLLGDSVPSKLWPWETSGQHAQNLFHMQTSVGLASRYLSHTMTWLLWSLPRGCRWSLVDEQHDPCSSLRSTSPDLSPICHCLLSTPSVSAQGCPCG